GLGYVVDSLEEANRLVEETTVEVYQQMVENVSKVSYALKEGYFTKKLLIDAVMQLLDI
ncbi:beta-1,6-galactofuranosyltransferase, partial [Streptococcus pneumoniae]|nr:beta-1,6-galactofuranosyltransferase [Streptococcus pneumoniae]